MDDILDPAKIVFCLKKLLLGFFLTLFVFQYTCCFFENSSAIFWFAAENGFDFALGND
jgi:hypothetical protein